MLFDKSQLLGQIPALPFQNVWLQLIQHPFKLFAIFSCPDQIDFVRPLFQVDVELADLLRSGNDFKKFRLGTRFGCREQVGPLRDQLSPSIFDQRFLVASGVALFAQLIVLLLSFRRMFQLV